jgi:WD40 repeat protein
VELLARAVHATHEKGVVHRDLKPANVLLAAGDPEHGVRLGGPEEGSYFQPKVTDFGLAKLLAGAGPTLTYSGAVLGTPSYMAPEQAAGQARAVGPAADVYALGAILYELLTGRPPFQAETPLETLLQVQSQEPVSPSRLQPKLPHDLATICPKCLAKEVPRRYASAQALADDLGRFLAGEPVRARPTGRGERLVKWARRRPALAALIALGVAMAGGLAGGGWWYAAQERPHALRETALRQEADTNAELSRRQTRNARRAESDARNQRDAALLNLYVSQINLAQREWEAGHVARVVELLEACLPREGEKDLRGFEWHYLWALCNGELLTLRGHTTMSVAWAPDGRRLAAGGADRTVHVWDADSGRKVHALAGHTAWVWTVVFSRDGRRLASATGGRWNEGGEVKVWDAVRGREVCTLQQRIGRVSALVFSPDGRRLVTADSDRGPATRISPVSVWDATTGRLVRSFRLAGPLYSAKLVFSPDGQRLAWASHQAAGVCDPATGRLLLSVPTGDETYELAFRPDNQRLATADESGTVEVWDAAGGGAGKPRKPLLTLKGHSALVTGLAFSPDGVRLASVDANGVGRVWDGTTGAVLLTFKGHRGRVNCVGFRPDGRQLATGGEDGTVRVWEALTGPPGRLAFPQHSLPSGKQFVRAVAFRPDSQRLATVSDAVRVWEAATGQCLLRLEGSGPAGGVVFSPDGRRLAGPQSSEVAVWEVATGRQILRIKAGTPADIPPLAFSPEGRGLACPAGDGRTVKVWDVSGKTGEAAAPLLTVQGHTNPVRGLAFSRDGRLASHDGAVRIWDVSTGRGVVAAPLLTLPGFDSTCMALRPDGRRLAVGTRVGRVEIWDISAGSGERTKPALTFRGHTGWVLGVAFSPDGRRLASASEDKTVKVWEAATGQEILSLKGAPADTLVGVAFSPDGRSLAAWGSDRSVKV